MVILLIKKIHLDSRIFTHLNWKTRQNTKQEGNFCSVKTKVKILNLINNEANKSNNVFIMIINRLIIINYNTNNEKKIQNESKRKLLKLHRLNQILKQTKPHHSYPIQSLDLK